MASGLPAPSVVRPVKIATIEATHAVKLGRLPEPLLAQVTQAIVERLA